MARRLKIVQLCFLAGFLAVLGKLFYWQILDHQRLGALAIQQYSTRREVPAERGIIYTLDDFPLVLNTKTYRLFANPSQLKITPAELNARLREIIGPDFTPPSLLENKNLQWLSLATEISSETRAKIEKLAIAGLGFDEEEKRFYPEASLSAHLLGFVGVDENGRSKGYFGLEGFYDNELRGKTGWRFFEQDALGRPIPFTLEAEEKPIAGRNLFLNLDRAVQFIAEKYLKEGIEKYKAKSGTVTVMNPQTGAVLAMAAFPSYDPASYYNFNSDLYRNPVISSVFEPGSIFKVLVMAAGIDSGAVRAEETCPICAGPRQIYDYTIRTWNDRYYPNSSMTDIIVHSDNVGMTYVSGKMGLDVFYEYLKRFGLGEKTGIDLQGELAAPLREKKNWYEIDLATASFGQGIAVTPIQMLAAVSAIANGGTLYQPQVVKKIIGEGRSVEIDPVVKGHPISPATAKIVTQMMIHAVEEGEAKWAKPAGYSIAGKTGTAQIPIAGHYDPEKTLASFIGFAPADHPRFVMLVTLSEPQTSPWGSETAAPLWFNIAKEIFRLWKIPPTG